MVILNLRVCKRTYLPKLGPVKKNRSVKKGSDLFVLM